MRPSLDQVRGLLLGTAVGDCVGHPFEGRRSVYPAWVARLVENPPDLLYTDDSVMTLGLTESLLECEGFDGAHMAARFAGDFERDPYRGYGSGVRDIFTAVLSGEPWDVAAASQFDGQGSFGNGASMRAAPVALFGWPDLEKTAELARQTARVTHTHPVGVDGAVIQAIATHHALKGSGFDPDA